MQNSTNNTKASLKIFTNKLIDYAGLFPPASLELPQALNNYIFYLQGPYNWMLSKFIIPAGKLSELDNLLNDLNINESMKIPLSVIFTGGNTKDNFLLSIDNDIKRILEFSSKRKNFVIENFEMKMPKMIMSENIRDISDVIEVTAKALNRSLNINANIYIEPVYDNDFDQAVIKAAEAISMNNNEKNLTGFKLRTGGTEASAFPTTQQIGFAIMTCLEYGIPMKCTAGLHHPIRHYNNEIQTNMHGFLNVFGAGILAYACDLDEISIDEILNEQEPFYFYFTDDGLKWNEFSISNDDITNARKNFMISYGSCSFDEPITDLKTMEWL